MKYSIGFNVTFEAPSPTNPLGNPPYPGWTSANGPNWVDFLTVKHNHSLLLTYNLAYGGATVDSNLVAPWRPDVLSLIDQVKTLFLPTYVPPDVTPASPSWTSRNTLFGIWIGINDVGNSYWKGSNVTDVLYADIFKQYADMVDELYSSGGRNFVFLNVPPVDLSPLTMGEGETAMETERKSIADFNKLIANLAKSVKTAHGEVNIWLIDTNDVFMKALAHPASYPQTAGYKNTTAYCKAYEK
jgi:phospholipase/lecithinase/hemolysin